MAYIHHPICQPQVSRKLLTINKTTKEGLFINNKNLKLTKTALIVAIYAALSLALSFLSFGAVQFRLSEVLTVLPAFTTMAIPGLTLGCALANLVGFLIGANPIGIIDAIVGSFATLLAAILSYYAGKLNNKWLKYILIPLPPVLINAIIVGLELTFVFSDVFTFEIFILNFVSVFIGQFTVCYILGIPLIYFLNKNDFYKKIF